MSFYILERRKAINAREEMKSELKVRNLDGGMIHEIS